MRGGFRDGGGACLSLSQDVDRARHQRHDPHPGQTVDYRQSKSVIKCARAQAGLSAPPENRISINRLTIDEELAFIVQGGATIDVDYLSSVKLGDALDVE